MSTTQHEQPIDILTPLLDVLWADGRLSFSQVRAIDQVATHFHVADVARRIARVSAEDDSGTLPPVALRPLLYALAVWVAAIDGRVHPSERRVLQHYATAWQLEGEAERRPRRVALGMARLAAGRPTATQLEALVRAVQRVTSAPGCSEHAA